MRIKVLEKVDWTAANGRRMLAFKPGEHTVKKEVGDDLVARGKAKEIPAPSVDEAKSAKSK